MYVCMYDSWHQAEVGDSPRLKLLPVILGVGRNPNVIVNIFRIRFQFTVYGVQV